MTIRINKALADAGICSRRKADELVAAREVTVNGNIVDSPGLQVDPTTDIITVHGKPINSTQKLSYVMLYKPTQIVCTAYDPENRTTVLDILPPEFKSQRLFPVGRLDFFSEGLLLLTNDGHLANRLTHPRYHLPKVYQVLIREEVTSQAVYIMQSGMTLREGETLAPVEVTIMPPNQPGTLLQLTLHQGINRQIRRMCRDLNLTILSLIRISQGPLQLSKLKSGQCRSLETKEVQALYQAAGLA